MAADGLFIFGAAGMALAAIGIYGLVSYAVKQSTHEIGIRMALGARSVEVVRHFLRRGLRLGGIGVIVGTVSALVLTRLLGSVLYGVSATDPGVVRRRRGGRRRRRGRGHGHPRVASRSDVAVEGTAPLKREPLGREPEFCLAKPLGPLLRSL